MFQVKLDGEEPEQQSPTGDQSLENDKTFPFILFGNIYQYFKNILNETTKIVFLFAFLLCHPVTLFILTPLLVLPPFLMNIISVTGDTLDI